MRKILRLNDGPVEISFEAYLPEAHRYFKASNPGGSSAKNIFGWSVLEYLLSKLFMTQKGPGSTEIFFQDQLGIKLTRYCRCCENEM